VNGAVCCIEETTFCCPPTDIHPSHCCPRWNVCCEGGRYGCCEPDEVEGKDKSDGKGRLSRVAKSALAIFEIPDWSGDTPLYGMSIDLSEGYRQNQQVISGFNDWGEITRVFVFDPQRSIFYLPQANFTANTTNLPINLYSTDPKTGITTSKQVSVE